MPGTLATQHNPNWSQQMHLIKFETNYYVCNCDLHVFSTFEINFGLLMGEFSGRYMDRRIELLQLVQSC